MQAHQQGTDPLWVPPDEIPSHTDVAALYKAMAGLCPRGDPTDLPVVWGAVILCAYKPGMGSFATICYTVEGHVHYHEVGLTDAIL